MKTGIHIKPCNIGEAEKHNQRDKDYLDGVRKSGRNIYIFEDLTHLNQSEIFKWNRDYDYSRGDLIALLQEEIQIYKDKIGRLPMLKDRVRTDKKTGKVKTISGWSPIREGVIPIKADTQLSDFAKINNWLLSKGIHPIRIDLHHDEGYQDGEGKRKFNHHAHIVMDYLNHSTGKTVKLSKEDIEELQGVVADALGMERGQKKAVTGAKHLNPAEYRQEEAERKAKEAQNKASEAVSRYNAIINQLKEKEAILDDLTKEINQNEYTSELQAEDFRRTRENLDQPEKQVKDRQNELNELKKIITKERQQLLLLESSKFEKALGKNVWNQAKQILKNLALSNSRKYFSDTEIAWFKEHRFSLIMVPVIVAESIKEELPVNEQRIRNAGRELSKVMAGNAQEQERARGVGR